MSKRNKLIATLAVFVILFCSVSLSFPVSVAGEELGLGYGFPLPWHAAWVTSASRAVWIPGLILNIICASALAFWVVHIWARTQDRSSLSLRAKAALLFCVSILGVGALVLYLSNFLDPYVTVEQVFDFAWPSGMTFGPLFNRS
ncbi:hypothetical protein [Viridibacterium curvum]|uniref:hypothetical protein n=1 Tax=Viridibacterium curvum TaxID=1101404 RepID=UPI0031E909D6